MKHFAIFISLCLLLSFGCNKNVQTNGETQKKNVQRFGWVIKVKPEKLDEYRQKGCDVHLSLSGCSGINMAKAYYDFVCNDNLDEIIRTVESYDAEQAVRAVRAFVSIAEYERFKGPEEDKIKNYVKEKNAIKLYGVIDLGYIGRKKRLLRGERQLEPLGIYEQPEPCNWSKQNRRRHEEMLNPRQCNWSQGYRRRAEAITRKKNPYIQ